MNKKILKEILSIPTYTWQEERLREYVISKVVNNLGTIIDVDEIGNVYITKGQADIYPCLVAHLDSVHPIQEYKVVEEYHPNAQGEDKLSLVAYDNENNRCGIGGDDKAGVFICLELLKKFDNIKVFLPVAEEIGCKGTRKARGSFFKDVGYAVQFDSTENNTMSKTLMGVPLYKENSEFIQKCENLILEHGITEWRHHPYTDTMVLKERFNFSCLNFAAGYYGWHSDHEYVVVEDVENAINLGQKVIKILGNKKYKFKYKKKEGSSFLLY
jgi:tripeptide aminopeptidase